MKISLPKNGVLRVFGPALVSVVEGKACILGKVFGPGDKVVIHKMRSYAVLALDDLVIEANLGPGATIQEPSPNEEPIVEWIELAKKIIGKNKKVIIMGPIDSGKSSIAMLLTNTALNSGLKKVAIIDSDVGQADIGPPGFITLSMVSSPAIWMRELSPAIMRFIGDIRPQYHVEKIIWEVARLTSNAVSNGADMVVIDTDGWIQDSNAIDYKIRLIEAVWPDEVVIMGEQYGKVFRKLEGLGIKVHVFKSPPVIKSRNRDERRWLRSEQYRKFLEEAPVKKYMLSDLIVIGNPLFEGEEVDTSSIESVAGTKIYYASLLPDSLNLVIQPGSRVIPVDKIKEMMGVQRIRFYASGFEKGIYVSLSKKDIAEYPGVIENIDYTSKTISIKTMFDGKPLVIKFSRMRITKDYTEQLIE